MNYSIVTPPTDEALESFLPLERVRGLCLVGNTTRHDSLLRDYRAAAFTDGQDEARSSFLPQVIEATFRTPKAEPKNFGLEDKVTDPDNVFKGTRLPRGPVISIESVKFRNGKGVVEHTLDASEFYPSHDKFIMWDSGFTWPQQLPSFVVRYTAGVANPEKLASLRIAVGELLAAKWDAKGGVYKMPTTAARVFHSLRGSRTYLPTT